MSDIPEIDPTKDQGAAGGATGGGDDPRDLRFPDAPTDTSDTSSKWRKYWPGGATPKDPYKYEKLPMSEHSGLPPSKGGPKTAETSFIEGETSGRVMNADSLKMELAHETIQTQYPQYGKDGNLLTLEVVDGKVVVFGPWGGRTSLFQADGRTLNPQLLKLKNVRKTLGPY